MMNATIVTIKNIQKNKSMKPIYKVMLKTFVAGGTVFAAGQATWDFMFMDDDNFNQWKFMTNFVIFGLFMIIMVKYNYKSKIENNPDSNL